MDKIFTHSILPSQKSASGAVNPNPVTLEKIKQFARVYANSSGLGKFGGIILN